MRISRSLTRRTTFKSSIQDSDEKWWSEFGRQFMKAHWHWMIFELLSLGLEISIFADEESISGVHESGSDSERNKMPN